VDDEAEVLAAAIGRRVRTERQARRWTLDQLADAAGVSRRMLVNVEQGAANPSVATLLKLGQALGVGLPELVEPPSRDPVRVTRRGEGATLWSGEAGGRGVLVAGITTPDVVELWEWTLPPGEVRRSEAHSPRTHELLHVLEGALEIQVGDETIALAAGDAVSFPGDAGHTYANAGPTVARFTLAVFEPRLTAPGGSR
jgi:transcriptional regulator with XRE-family HTH domain